MVTVRLFIAIPLEEHVKSHLDHLRRDLQGNIPSGISWVRIDSIHLTLKFLGEVDERNIPGLTGALMRVCGQFDGFTLGFQGLGCFPNIRQARVIWAGSARCAPLIALQSAVEEACRDLGFPVEERRFSPHLTLGRIKNALKPADIAYLEEKIRATSTSEIIPMTISEVILFKSELQRDGAKYSVLARAQLNPV